MRGRHTTTAAIARFTVSSSNRRSTTAGTTGFASRSGSISSSSSSSSSSTTTPRAPPPSARLLLSSITRGAMSTSATNSAPPPPPDEGEGAGAASETKLPPLSGAEFREYNRLAEHMDLFHNHFRSTWETLYSSASSGRRAQGLSIRAFIHVGLEFVSHLEMHHGIEERYVFPHLARRMPEFRTGKERDLPPAPEDKADEAAVLLRQHAEIHRGMEGLRDYLRGCLSGETELQMSALKAQLDTWGTVLWTHLAQEVKTLGAENMRRYWSLEEMRKIRM